MNLVEFINPLVAIARELKTIRELYEMELAARDKPLIRSTEDASPGDTEVFYGEGDTKPKGRLRRMLEGLTVTSDEEDEDVLD